MLRAIVVTFGIALLLQPAPPATGHDLIDAQIEKSSPIEPMLLQADELVDDGTNNQIFAKGNVVLRYKGYTLVADDLTYDRKSHALNAIGNVRVTEPDGALITAGRITLNDEFRDGFVHAFEAIAKNTPSKVKRIETR
jgi:LPS-assembly protein